MRSETWFIQGGELWETWPSAGGGNFLMACMTPVTVCESVAYLALEGAQGRAYLIPKKPEAIPVGLMALKEIKLHDMVK
jgi:hypothetical protein